MKISLVVPNRNNLKYFKWSYDSIRKNQGEHEVYICAAADACTDDTVVFYKELAEKDPFFSYIVNEGPERLGHTILYDRIVDELVKTDIAMIWHCDMYLCPNAFDYVEKYMSEKTIVSLTRIEPPLHPPGVEKITQDFGIEPEEFKEKELLNWFEMSKIQRKNKTTTGIFAPWAFNVRDFTSIGGHDILYAPQSKEDCIIGDRNIIFIENDNIKINRIDHLFEEYANLSEIRDDGKELIDFKKNDIKLYSATAKSKGEIGKNRISKILRNKTTKDIYKIRTNWGETVCTSDHSLLNKNLETVKPKDLIKGDVWEPIKLNDWTRRTVRTEIDMFDFVKDRSEYSDLNINNLIRDIDCYGNNNKLINICEYLGFYVAEGSVSDKTVSICNTQLDVLDSIKSKSMDLFTVDYHEKVEDQKENCKLVHIYRFIDENVSKFIGEICGIGSEHKRVPDFIYNLPKCYQEAFLYGYLLGDGYLGTSITRQKEIESFSIDKRMLFNKRIFPLLNWKSTSKSALLTCGINYLLRKNYEIKTNIHFDPNKGEKGVYNISTRESYKDDILEITKLNTNSDEYVYDLEIDKSHTFIDAMGLFGLHNSDIFNRFDLDDIKFTQTWEGCVYHMTCRGSRYNPGLTKVGTESKEWLEQNNKSSRNFIRKWGHFVRHDDTMKPIVPNRYDVGFVVENCDERTCALIEPWCDVLYSTVNYNRYISVEEKNTMFDLRKKLRPISDEPINDIIVEFDASQLTTERFELFNNLQLILDDSGQVGSFELDIFKITINKLEKKTNNLISIDDSWYQSKLK